MHEASPEKGEELTGPNGSAVTASGEQQPVVGAAAWQRTEEQIRLITENTRDLICLLDLAENYIYATPSYAAVLGYRPADLIGQHCSAIVHPSDAPLLKKTLAAATTRRQ